MSFSQLRSDTSDHGDHSPGDQGGPSPVDVLIVGAGVTGIYQLYRAREAGFSVVLVEAGSGVGGTWYWNRYPGARFDSESYSYGYLFSEELFDEWEWKEHFAAQPETEQYFNHVVDRFDLRRDMRFDTRVTAAVWEAESGTWTVTLDDADTVIVRYVVAATGVLSVPFFPDVPGRDRFEGSQHHTGQWPADPVDFAGKRVAVVGTGSSGVQIVPVIAPEVASLTVMQRSANWCTPLNNGPITPDEQVRLRADFESIRETLNTSIHGFLHEPPERTSTNDSVDERTAFFEKMWQSPGFRKLTTNYTDLFLDAEINGEWCDFVASKIRSVVHDPDTADRLVPKDHGFGEKRPPFVSGYFESFNEPHVDLVDLRSTPITRITESGIETSDAVFDVDLIVWATGFDFGTGALNRMGIVGRDGVPLTEHWQDGPTTFLGVQTAGFPNFFFPGGPHAAAGNNPRYNGDQVDFVTEVLVHARASGQDVIEVTAEAEERWCDMIERNVQYSSFTEKSYYFGTNVPGKPKRFLLNSGGRPKLFREIERVREDDWRAFALSSSPVADR